MANNESAEKDLVARLFITRGFLDSESICSCAKVSKLWTQLAYEPTTFDRRLDLSVGSNTNAKIALLQSDRIPKHGRNRIEVVDVRDGSIKSDADLFAQMFDVSDPYELLDVMARGAAETETKWLKLLRTHVGPMKVVYHTRSYCDVDLDLANAVDFIIVCADHQNFDVVFSNARRHELDFDALTRATRAISFRRSTPFGDWAAERWETFVEVCKRKSKSAWLEHEHEFANSRDGMMWSEVISKRPYGRDVTHGVRYGEDIVAVCVGIREVGTELSEDEFNGLAHPSECW